MTDKTPREQADELYEKVVGGLDKAFEFVENKVLDFFSELDVFVSNVHSQVVKNIDDNEPEPNVSEPPESQETASEPSQADIEAVRNFLRQRGLRF